MLTGTQTNITVSYDDDNGELDFVIATADSTTLGVASFDDTYFSVTSGNVSLIQSAIDHGSISGLSDDDHTQYVHNTIARSITAQHTFAPGSAQAPFVLGANAQGQLVTGLNSEFANGHRITVSDSEPGSIQANDIWVQ